MYKSKNYKKKLIKFGVIEEHKTYNKFEDGETILTVYRFDKNHVPTSSNPEVIELNLSIINSISLIDVLVDNNQDNKTFTDCVLKSLHCYDDKLAFKKCTFKNCDISSLNMAIFTDCKFINCELKFSYDERENFINCNYVDCKILLFCVLNNLEDFNGFFVF